MTTNDRTPDGDNGLDDEQRRKQQDTVERIINRDATAAGDDVPPDRQQIRQRQLDALRDMATIRLYPTADPDHAPTISDEEQERMRQMRADLHGGQVLVELRLGNGAVVVDPWAGPPAAGWSIDWYDLELRPDGLPFGALIYRNDEHADLAVRVGVQWDHWTEQLVAVALHETEDRHADNAEPDVLRDLERDARGRLGALLGSYATIGSRITSTTAEDALLNAAGLPRDTD